MTFVEELTVEDGFEGMISVSLEMKDHYLSEPFSDKYESDETN